jgi:hypothetical protein
MYGQDISNTQTKWQLSAGDETTISGLKIDVLWDTADSNPYLVPPKVQASIHNPSKTTGSVVISCG